jgi:hypothetical protein
MEWTAPNFVDAEWEEGASGFGFGDGDDATVLEDMAGAYTTLYLRRAFEVEDPSAFGRLELSVLADDGMVAYLNGAEVARLRAGAAGERLAYNATAALAPEPPPWADFAIEAKHLRPGRNVLAIQGLNVSLASSDFSLIPVLNGVLPAEPGRGRALLDRFRAAAGERAVNRIAYLEARLAQLEGGSIEAIDGFAALVDDAQQPEPLLRLAECLMAVGDAASAERRLRAGLEGAQSGERELWERWIQIQFLDLKRSPADVLRDFPAATAEAAFAADLRWLLDRLASKEPLRLDSGGSGYTSPSGEVWSRDRFFLSGYRRTEVQNDRIVEHPQAESADEVAETGDDPLYRSERWFRAGDVPAPGYRLPLPQGSYTVRLHFAEVYFRERGKRVFDVRIEGKTVLEGYEPAAAGFATARVETFQNVAVEDGFLDVEFIDRADNPQVAAIEVETYASR